MTGCDDYIERAKRELPDLCSNQDLIRIGFFKSEQAALNARKKGTAPDYFKLPHGSIVYPKKGIICCLEKSKHQQGCFNEDHNSGRPYSEGKSKSNKARVCF